MDTTNKILTGVITVLVIAIVVVTATAHGYTNSSKIGRSSLRGLGASVYDANTAYFNYTTTSGPQTALYYPYSYNNSVSYPATEQYYYTTTTTQQPYTTTVTCTYNQYGVCQ